MPISTTLPTQTTPTFCSDENIAVRAGGDILSLTPPWQVGSAGTDGAFAAGFPWVLTSATVDFAANGIQPNQIVHLTRPPSQYPGGGHILAIDAVSAGSLTLRRLHSDLNVGQPPAPAAGLTGVTFSIPTLLPQIEEASFAIKQKYNIDETIFVRSSTYMHDRRDLRMAVVLAVLLARYTQECRTDRGDFPRKIELIRQELGEVMGRVQVRWGTSGEVGNPASLFGAKVSR